MSRIDGLIAKLCPNGVYYRAIGDSMVSKKVIAGATPKSGVAEYWENGTIPWMSSGEVNKGTIFQTDKLITEAAYNSSSTRMVPAGAVVIALAGQGKTRGTVARTRIELCTNQSLASITVAESMDSDFLFHFLRTQYRQLREVSSGDGTRGGLNLQMIRTYEVPVPPIEVQREVVHILDQFTSLEAELETKLEAELDARQRQYEHYRHEALSFGTHVPLRPLGELARNLDSRRRPVTKSARIPGDVPYYGASGIVDYVSESIFDGDYLLVSEDGANLLARSSPIAFSISGRTWVNNHAHVLEFNTNTERRFVEIYLNSIDLTPFISGAAQPKLNKANLNNIPIPDPSFSEKERIVSELDEFHTVVTDLSINLPAEIAARRQQYEYYCHRLLTFEQAMA